MKSLPLPTRRDVAWAFGLLFISAAAGAQDSSAARMPNARALTLQGAISIAQQRGLAAEAARSTRDAARASDHAFNSRLLPQLVLQGNAVDLDRGINQIDLPTGEKRFVSQSNNTSRLGLDVAQQLPWTGGRLTVGSELSRIDLFGDQSSRTWATTPVIIGLQQDLFRPRTIVWDSRRQAIVSSLAERQYLEAREDVAAATATAFFDYYAAMVALQNATGNAAVNDTLFTLNKGRYEVGKIGENDLLASELQLLRARSSYDNAKLERDRTEATLRRALNLPVSSDTLAIAPPDMVQSFDVDPDIAVQQALRNSSVIEQAELEALAARRNTNENRLNNRFNASINATVGFNQTAEVFGQAYQSPLGKQRLTVGLDMPLMQWGAGRAEVQAAKANETRVAANARARRDQLQEEARFAALQLTQSQRMVALSAKADTVATKRFEVAKNRYVIGKIGISDLFIAQNEKDQALTAYVQALRTYWTNYYRLRRVTLYDFEKSLELAQR